MPATTKHRRKLTLGSRDFYWWVVLHDDLCKPEVCIVSADKKLVVRYVLDASHSFVRVFGVSLYGEPETATTERFYACPRLDAGIASPRTARKIIEWCLSTNRELISVGWNGYSLSSDTRRVA